MLLENHHIVIPILRFTLKYDTGTEKIITVRARDKVICDYKQNGEMKSIKGVVTKIGCNFNSSFGAVGTTVYMQIDGSNPCEGRVEYIQPSQVLNLIVISSSDTVDNVVCSVDPDSQRITLIRENEAGVFQYSLDGITWKYATGAPGMSAYECAVKLGYEGTEEEWLASLKAEAKIPDQIVVERNVGGYSVGDIIPEDTLIADIIKQLLAPGAPESDHKVYFGVTENPPVTLDYLTAQEIEPAELLKYGIKHKYTALNQYLVYAYKKSLGELKSIKDPSGFENILSWKKVEYTSPKSTTYYIYYTDETKTIENYQMKFIYTEE